MTQPARLERAAATPSPSERLVDQLANRIGTLGVELADVAGNLQEVAGRVSSQADRFGHLQKTAETMVSANHGIANASGAVQSAATAAGGLRVAASEVKSLAEAPRQATHLIGDTVRDLDGQVGNLISASGDASLRAKNAGEGAQQIQGIIVRIQDGFTAVGREIDGVAKAAGSNLAHCDTVIDELGNLAKGVELSSAALKRADDRVAKLLELSEGLIELIADSGVETSDAPLIRVVIDTAKQISKAFESAV